MESRAVASVTIFLVLIAASIPVAAWVPCSARVDTVLGQPSRCLPICGITMAKSGSPTGQNLRQKLLRTAAMAAKDPKRYETKLLDVVEELESMNPTPNPALSSKFSGRWALIYAASGERRQGLGSGTLQALLDTSYDSVRKFLPALAGVGGGGSRSFQIVDLEGGKVDNTVEFQLPVGPNVFIDVAGSVAPSKQDPGVRVEVTFDSFSIRLGSFPNLVVPLPRPVGAIDVTFLDDKVRISRGSRGTLFVAARVD